MDISKYRQMKNRTRARLVKVANPDGNIYQVIYTLNDPETGNTEERVVAVVTVQEISDALTAINRTRNSYQDLQTDIAALEAQP